MRRKRPGGKTIDLTRYKSASPIVRQMMEIADGQELSLRSIAGLAGTRASTVVDWAKKTPRLDLVEACLNAMGYRLAILQQEDEDMPVIVSRIINGETVESLAGAYGFESAATLQEAVKSFMKGRRIAKISDIRGV